MHKVDRYLLKNSLYIFLLANIIACVPRGKIFFLWLNIVALAICLLLLFLIRLTIRRYAVAFGKSGEDVKNLLGRYIEDDTRGKLSFYDYLQRQKPSTSGNA